MAYTYYCPFYKWDEKMRLYCEGARVCMITRVTYNKFRDTYCGSLHGWKSCSIAEILNEAYLNDEDKEIEDDRSEADRDERS